MQIDFSIEVLKADASVTPRSFTKTSDWFSPDCDSDPVPVPPGGALEGESGYACESDGDCHLIVKHRPRRRRQHRAHRAERSLHDQEVGRAPRAARPRRHPPR
jgi:hypothetical protein